MTPRLAFEHITHAFGPVQVLTDVTFAVAPGGFTAVIGPSGCGKSTLLTMAAGLLRPASGTVVVQGADEVGLVPQQALLFPWKTLAENVGFKLALQRRPAPERARRIEKALRDVGLEGFGNHYPGQLSGGMQKRGAIARTLIYDPPLILMDEPFGALDAQTRMVLQRDLQTLVGRTGSSVMLVTHDITEAVLLADEVVVLSNRPARVLARHPVPLPRPRGTFEPHRNPGFAETYEAIWTSFRNEVA